MELEQLKKDVKELKDNIDSLKISLKKIELAFLGSEFNNKKGLVYILDDIEKRIAIIEQAEAERLIYRRQRNTAFGIVGTGLGALFIYIFKKLGNF